MGCKYRGLILKNNNTKLISIKWFIVAIIIALVVWLAFPFIVSIIFHPTNPGEFGDMFGSLNALFAALAFVGLIYAILLQREELKLQREELRLAREELTNQTKVISKQLEAMKESMDFEKEREHWESEPVLINTGGSKSEDRKFIGILNKGVRITELTAEILNSLNLKALITPNKVLDKENNCNLVIIGSKEEYSRETIIKINYKTRLNKEGFKMFRIPERSLDIVPHYEDA